MIYKIVLAFLGQTLFFSCAPEDNINNYTVYMQANGLKDVINASISMNIALSCTQVFNGIGSFTQSSIIVTGTSSSIQVLKNTACSLTINSFFDGTNSYSSSAPLLISISALGVVSSSGSINNPPSYIFGQNNPNIYLFLVASSSTSLTFVYTYDPAVISFITIGI